MSVSRYVNNLRGIPLSTVTPTDQQVLAYVASLNRWTPTTSSGGLSSLPTVITYVDAANGNDSTGVAGRFDKPFLTITAANSAASSASLKLVWVRPGNYNEQVTSINNIAIFMEYGAINNYTGSGNAWIFPANSGENYFLLGRGQIISTNASGSAYAMSGGVSGTGYLIIEAIVVAGRGTAGNNACNFSNIDPTVYTSGTSLIRIDYIEGNTKTTQDTFVANYIGGPCRIEIGSVNCLSTANQAGAFTITDTSPQNDGILDLHISVVTSTGTPTSVVNGSVHLFFNSATAGCRAFIGRIKSAQMSALSVGTNCEVHSQLIENTSATYSPVVGGSLSHGPGKIIGALIQNLNSGATPFLNGHNVDHSLIFDHCRFENPNSTPSASPFLLVQDSSSFDVFDSCYFYLASSNANGIIDLETSAAVMFKGTNIIMVRAGGAPSIGSGSTVSARILGKVASNANLGSGVSITDGEFVFDSALTLANSAGNYFS